MKFVLAVMLGHVIPEMVTAAMQVSEWYPGMLDNTEYVGPLTLTVEATGAVTASIHMKFGDADVATLHV